METQSNNTVTEATIVKTTKATPKAKKAKLPVPTKLTALQTCVRDARELHKRLKTDFIEGISQIAIQVKMAKAAAKKEGVEFSTLFGDPSDTSKFPFTQQWANTIVRVCESDVLAGDMSKLPADLNTLATLASTPADKREEVLTLYYTLREGVVIDGVVVEKLNTQAAMRKAKSEVVKDVTPKGKKVKAPKGFNASAMARKLHASLGDEGLSELMDAIERLLSDLGVRE